MSSFSGYQTNVIRNDSIAFDWKKFWTYLKPYFLKFLGAIAVSNLLQTVIKMSFTKKIFYIL